MERDLSKGVAEDEVREGVPVLGEVDGVKVVLVRAEGALYAVGAECSHYHGPLAEGLVAGGTIRCPWHHACFDLSTGRALGPAIAPIACFDVESSGGVIRVGKQRAPVTPQDPGGPKAVVIVGAGAAGVACAETLRQEGHRGAITLIAGEGSDPVDRPNLSKDYLAGNAPEEWVFLRTADALKAIDVTVVAGNARAIDPKAHTVTVGDRAIPWDALLIATGAEPVRLPLEGAELPHVHTLRTLADSRAIAAAAKAGTRAVVIGASFIGLEVAASLRARGAEVTVVGPEAVPLARVLGDEVGAWIRRVHEGKGVTFRLGRKPVKITKDVVELDDGTRVDASLVVTGVGVKPRLELATAAGLPIDRGIVVDAELRAAPGIWAAGDVARYPWNGESVRIEHWQVAVRHGQAVARVMLGRAASNDVPFFWSQHHDVTLGYVGHAERFDRAEIHGDLEARDAHVVYADGGRVRAVATIGRDALGRAVERAFELGDPDAVTRLVR